MLEIGKVVIIWIAIAAIIFLIWFIIELALTMKKARSTISNIEERIEPTLSHVEQITSSLEPAIARVDPLLERASLTVDTINLELMQVDQILEDVSEVTDSLGSAVKKVNDIANAPRALIDGAARKVGTVVSKKGTAKRVSKAIEAEQQAHLTAGDAQDEQPFKKNDDFAQSDSSKEAIKSPVDAEDYFKSPMA